MESEPNEREWKCRYEREKAVANNIANSFSRVVELSTDAKGILADLAYLEITDYRAELAAPAGDDDRETVNIARDIIIRHYDNWVNLDAKGCLDKLQEILTLEFEAALYIARQAERSKVPPPDEIHRDGYNKGVKAERQRWEAAAREVLQKVNLIEYCDTATKEDVDEYREARDTLAALVRCEKEVEIGEHIKS